MGLGPYPEIGLADARDKAQDARRLIKRDGKDPIAERGRAKSPRLWVDDLAGLLNLVEIGAVELHPWNATIDDIEHPDMLVFHLDPGEGVACEFVIETALRLRRMLKDEGLAPWPKLTGGKGLHLMAPVDRTMDHDQGRAYAKQIASASPPPRRTATRLLLHPVSALGASSSTTCAMVVVRRLSAPGRRGRGQDFQLRRR